VTGLSGSGFSGLAGLEDFQDCAPSVAMRHLPPGERVERRCGMVCITPCPISPWGKVPDRADRGEFDL